MNLGDVNLACASALVDELASHGLRHACVSPGSRSTPLALAIARHPGLALHVHLDERSSGFFALGLAKATRCPVAVVCTSGTAAAEMYPAVVEASQARVPLFVLTADRPPRLRGTGANQTIDQVHLYGRYARAYLELGVPETERDVAAWRRAARDAALASGGAQPGPVHLNCPFEEPLIPSGKAPGARPGNAVGPARDRSAWISPTDADPEPVPDDIERVAAELSGARGVVVIGASPWRPPGETVTLARQLGWPVLAEPTSDVRRPDAGEPIVLSAGQSLLGCEPFLERSLPDLVLQIGATPTSRSTQRFVARVVRRIVVDALHLEPDPEGTATLRLRCDPERVSSAVLAGPFARSRAGWLEDWLEADAVARRALDAVLDATDGPTELRIARDVAAAVPVGGTLFVGNSMPIRDLDHAMVPRDGLRVIANRGASGIDGLVSTALGVAAARTGPTVALLGDLSFVYDTGALLWNARRGPGLTIVVANNGGGTIFSFLGQRDLPEFEPLFETPHGLDLGAICAAAGVGHERVERMRDLPPALERAHAERGVHVVEVPVDPDVNRIQHAQVQTAVDDALAAHT